MVELTELANSRRKSRIRFQRRFIISKQFRLCFIQKYEEMKKTRDLEVYYLYELLVKAIGALII